MTRPAKLQINKTGAWEDVLRFDMPTNLNDKGLFLSDMVVVAGIATTTTSPTTHMRVVADDVFAECLAWWSAEGGWKAASNAPPNATKPVPNRPSANAGASGPATAENGAKALKSKGA